MRCNLTHCGIISMAVHRYVLISKFQVLNSREFTRRETGAFLLLSVRDDELVSTRMVLSSGAGNSSETSRWKKAISVAYNNKKKPVAEHVYADEIVWQCTSCNCWSRKEFVVDEEPRCPLCDSPMVEETRNIRVD